jgi:hypothetical protein
MRLRLIDKLRETVDTLVMSGDDLATAYEALGFDKERSQQLASSKGINAARSIRGERCPPLGQSVAKKRNSKS